jgi:hypothetical protein
LIESSLDGSRSLFDLEKDPGETTDVGAGVPHEVQALEAHVAPLPSPVPTPLPSEQSKRDAAVLERLRALGYFQ